MKYKTKKVNSKTELLSKYSKKEFNSPFRSTISLIELFFENPKELEKVIPGVNTYEAVFEDETKALDGTGPASCTDLRLFNSLRNYCIEAKRTEPKYETVKKYISKDIRHEKVVEGWLGIINKKCCTKLTINNVNDCTYQMIHRFASACKVEGPTEMMYFCFDLSEMKKTYYKSELEKIKDISNSKIPIKLILFNTVSSEGLKKLEDDWNIKKQRDLSLLVKSEMAGKVMDVKFAENIEI